MEMKSSGRQKKPHQRPVKLLSSGAEVMILVPDWVKFSEGSFAKKFDDDTTEILRVWRHKANAEGVMVYGMKAKGGKVVKEAYEIVGVAALAPTALDQVAAHCGLKKLRENIEL